jgi:SAM-dependent methyltransferase
MKPDKNAPHGLDPSPIIALATAYWDSQALLTANRLGLFALLGAEPRTLREVADELGTQARGTRLLLNACIALGLVQEDAGRYANSALGSAFLTPGRPGYLGDAIRYSDDLYASWGQLQQALYSGAPAMPAAAYTGDDPGQTRNFVYGMHNRALGIGRFLVDLVDLAGRQRMIDVGGGPGTYSAMFAQRHPELHSRVLDLPGVLNISREIIAAMGVSDRVVTQASDYLRDDFPQGNDVVLISGVFHRETEARCRDLVRRAWQALDNGGILVVSDVFTDPGGKGPLFATLFGLNMMLTSADGGVHADADVASWMDEQNFGDIDTLHFPPPMPHRIVTGIKR